MQSSVKKDRRYAYADSIDYLDVGTIPVHVLEGCELGIVKVFAE